MLLSIFCGDGSVFGIFSNPKVVVKICTAFCRFVADNGCMGVVINAYRENFYLALQFQRRLFA